ncbi:MAG: hypothetical protein V2I33_20850 [Kangiellaceae bacterium]|jgi:hypothetical protein|nr:hypothetical protein [Kangiellaceae bacterium]
MADARLHAFINLLLTTILFGLVFSSIFLHYFSFLNYDIALLDIRYRIQYQDVEGTVFSRYNDFKKFACGKSDEAGIMTLCSNIDYFFAAGVGYLILACVILSFLFLNFLNLLMVILKRNNFITDIRFSHYLVSVLDIVAGAGYLLLSNIDNLEPPELQKVNVKA